MIRLQERYTQHSLNTRANLLVHFVQIVLSSVHPVSWVFTHYWHAVHYTRSLGWV